MSPEDSLEARVRTADGSVLALQRRATGAHRA